MLQNTPKSSGGSDVGKLPWVSMWVNNTHYRRAIPVRFLPAFPPKAVAANVPARTEWETAGLVCEWLRSGLDQAGRKEQQILVLADGGFDVLELWRRLPERVILVTRTARNRRLYYLPKTEAHG